MNETEKDVRFKPMDLTHVYIGVDNSQPTSVRVVFLDADAIKNPWPIWTDRIKNLEDFQLAIAPFLGQDVSIGAISEERGGHDPFGALTWLQGTGLRVSRPSGVSWESFERDWELYGVPRSYRRAFALARVAAYRHQAPGLVWELFSDADHLRQELDALLGRLAHLALAVPFPYGEASCYPAEKPEDTYCPF